MIERLIAAIIIALLVYIVLQLNDILRELKRKNQP
jgi:hypothetical protein